jgi:hypothetical protein
MLLTTPSLGASVTVQPTISTIPEQTIDEDKVLGPLPFTVSAESLGSLQFFFESTNRELVPLTRIVVGGSGANRTLTITPAGEKSGKSFITVIVSDGKDTAQTTFLLTVNNVDDLPTISTIPNQKIQAGKTTGVALQNSVKSFKRAAPREQLANGPDMIGQICGHGRGGLER